MDTEPFMLWGIITSTTSSYNNTVMDFQRGKLHDKEYKKKLVKLSKAKESQSSLYLKYQDYPK